MKQIHKAVQALESDIGFCRTSWILLKKLKNKIYRANFLGPICILEILRNNPSRGLWIYMYYQILMMAEMSKTEISAKILSESHQKLFSSRPG